MKMGRYCFFQMSEPGQVDGKIQQQQTMFIFPGKGGDRLADFCFHSITLSVKILLYFYTFAIIAQ